MHYHYYDVLLKESFATATTKSQDRNTTTGYLNKSLNNRNINNKKTTKAATTTAYDTLIKGLNLQKVLVGSHNKTPFYALVDVNERICLPLIQEE
jgi:hypothetical protein